MKLNIEVNVQEMNRIFEGLDRRRVMLQAGVKGQGNMVGSRSTVDYIALNEMMLASLESINEKLGNAANNAALWGEGLAITTIGGN